MEINRQQALALLESLSEFYPVPRAGLDLAATIAANAKRAQIEAERRFSVSLTLDTNGVKSLRNLLSALHRAMLPSRIARILGANIPFTSSVLIANVFGAFLGEALRSRLGGEWQLLEVNGQTLVALRLEKEDFTLPTYKAGKQFMNGDEDDVWFFYSVMVRKIVPMQKELRTIDTGDLKNPADYKRKLAEILNSSRPAGRP